MKHTILHKRVSVVMALLVLFSTMSFAIEKHFCGTTLVDVAIFTQAHGCGMEIPSDIEKPCCKNDVEIIKGQDELKYSFNDLSLDQQQFVATFVYTYLDLFEGLPEQVIPFKDYSPPNLFYDRQVLHETYLI